MWFIKHFHIGRLGNTNQLPLKTKGFKVFKNLLEGTGELIRHVKLWGQGHDFEEDSLEKRA